MLRAAKLTRLALKVREALSICVSGRLLAVAVCVERSGGDRTKVVLGRKVSPMG